MATLETLEGKIDSLNAHVQSLDKALRGNGQPGIDRRLAEVETRQIDCPARAGFDQLRTAVTKQGVKLGVIVGGVVLAINLLPSIIKGIASRIGG